MQTARLTAYLAALAASLTPAGAAAAESTSHGVGVRVWVRDSALQSLERSLAPVIGKIICVAPVPYITQYLPGLEVTIDDLRMTDCSASGLSLSAVRGAADGEIALRLRVSGLAARFSAVYCWATGYGWAKFWNCGPVSGEINNGTSAVLVVSLSRSVNGSLAVSARDVELTPDIGKVRLEVGFGMGGAFDSFGGVGGVFSLILGPMVSDILGQARAIALALALALALAQRGHPSGRRALSEDRVSPPVPASTHSRPANSAHHPPGVVTATRFRHHTRIARCSPVQPNPTSNPTMTPDLARWVRKCSHA